MGVQQTRTGTKREPSTETANREATGQGEPTPQSEGSLESSAHTRPPPLAHPNGIDYNHVRDPTVVACPQLGLHTGDADVHIGQRVPFTQIARTLLTGRPGHYRHYQREGGIRSESRRSCPSVHSARRSLAPHTRMTLCKESESPPNSEGQRLEPRSRMQSRATKSTTTTPLQ
jgi:hypothetical protein